MRERYQIIAAVVDEYYFETIVGRKPKNKDELYSFAHSIEKGVEYSINWDDVNADAVSNLKE